MINQNKFTPSVDRYNKRSSGDTYSYIVYIFTMKTTLPPSQRKIYTKYKLLKCIYMV